MNELNEMSVEELKGTRDQIDALLAKSKAEDFKKTAEFKELKKEYKELEKMANKLAKTHEFEVQIPVKFRVEVDVDFVDMCDNGNAIYSFGHHVTGKVAGKFPKDVLVELQAGVDDVCDSVCLKILRLKPGAYESLEACAEKIDKLADKMKENGIGVWDFND